MRSVIRDMFCNRLNPMDEMRVWESPGYRETRDRCDRLEKELLEQLDEERTQLYRQLQEARDQAVGNQDREAFACGFRLGALTMIEVLGGD